MVEYFYSTYISQRLPHVWDSLGVKLFAVDVGLVMQVMHCVT